MLNKKRRNQFINEFSLAGSAVEPNVTILLWNGEGDTAVTPDFDGGLGSCTSYHKAASSAEEKGFNNQQLQPFGEDGGKSLPLLAGERGGGGCLLAMQSRR